MYTVTPSKKTSPKTLHLYYIRPKRNERKFVKHIQETSNATAFKTITDELKQIRDAKGTHYLEFYQTMEDCSAQKARYKRGDAAPFVYEIVEISVNADKVIEIQPRDKPGLTYYKLSPDIKDAEFQIEKVYFWSRVKGVKDFIDIGKAVESDIFSDWRYIARLTFSAADDYSILPEAGFINSTNFLRESEDTKMVSFQDPTELRQLILAFHQTNNPKIIPLLPKKTNVLSIAEYLSEIFANYAQPDLFSWRNNKGLAAAIADELKKRSPQTLEDCKSYINEKTKDLEFESNGTFQAILNVINKEVPSDRPSAFSSVKRF